MKQYILTVLLALLYFLPARAQLQFSDSLRISLLTCSAGPDVYERFGHAGLRVLDLRDPQMDVTFHYGVFSFNAPNFIYRFVKGETDYQLGALYTQYFIQDYSNRGLTMTEQWLRLDSAQCQAIVSRLLINYLPENRTYRYSYFFDNCSTRPYHLINDATEHSIAYDTTWCKEITLREMVQEKTGTSNWLDFGIALAVANRSDVPATFEEQLFLPEYLSRAVDNAQIPVRIGEGLWMEPLVAKTDTLLMMRPDVRQAIDAEDPIRPNTVFALLLLAALLLTAWEWRIQRHTAVSNIFDTLLLAFLGVTGVIVWFLNFISLHPAVDHNVNCFWLLPTHLIAAILIWIRSCRRICVIYFGITFALIIVYVISAWITDQYCPSAFILLLAIILLRCYSRCSIDTSKNISNIR